MISSRFPTEPDLALSKDNVIIFDCQLTHTIESSEKMIVGSMSVAEDGQTVKYFNYRKIPLCWPGLRISEDREIQLSLEIACAMTDKIASNIFCSHCWLSPRSLCALRARDSRDSSSVRMRPTDSKSVLLMWESRFIAQSGVMSVSRYCSLRQYSSKVEAHWYWLCRDCRLKTTKKKKRRKKSSQTSLTRKLRAKVIDKKTMLFVVVESNR